MKFFIFLILTYSITPPISFCQCPQSGLKIQSALCDSPKRLIIDTITCSLLKVKWQGKQNHTYRIKAIGIDVATNQSYEAAASNYSCNNYGNCIATLPVKADSKISWSVQGVCTKDNNTISGYELNGPEAIIPNCVSVITPSTQTLRAYPNPTTGILNVEYSREITANTKVFVSDMAGKQVLSVLGNAVTRTGIGFQLDLHHLISGNYVLYISNGKDQSQAKFVLIRD